MLDLQTSKSKTSVSLKGLYKLTKFCKKLTWAVLSLTRLMPTKDPRATRFELVRDFEILLSPGPVRGLKFSGP